MRKTQNGVELFSACLCIICDLLATCMLIAVVVVVVVVVFTF